MRKSLNAMCNDLNISIQGQNREACDREELSKKWEELSNYVIGKIMHNSHHLFLTNRVS